MVIKVKKPPYSIPTMQEINSYPTNGYSVVSTFSGCGGSCLGFKMAGFETLWASEFIPAARKVYEDNFPGVQVDDRDIRQVKPDEILEAIGKEEVDVLEGSPPCAAFSTAGKRSASWGKVKQYSDTKQRVDDLFFEFARILKGIQPKVFVAENVSGLVKGKAKGYFKEIIRALGACGYKVEARLLDAQWLGVPQARQRIIFVGVREDLVEKFGIAPRFPKPFGYRYSLRDALPQLNSITLPPHGYWKGKTFENEPCPTVVQSGMGSWNYYVEEVKRVTGRTVPSFERIESELDKPMNAIQATDPEQTRYEVDISRYAIGDEWDKLKPGESSDIYFNLSRPSEDRPSPTITQKGGDVTEAAVTHPTEKRKFTIQELKRICAFPEDFKLTGTYSQQWERLGRSVPPLMMKAVAEVVRDEILDKCVTK